MSKLFLQIWNVWWYVIPAKWQISSGLIGINGIYFFRCCISFDRNLSFIISAMLLVRTCKNRLRKGKCMQLVFRLECGFRVINSVPKFALKQYPKHHWLVWGSGAKLFSIPIHNGSPTPSWMKWWNIQGSEWLIHVVSNTPIVPLTHCDTFMVSIVHVAL